MAKSDKKNVPITKRIKALSKLSIDWFKLAPSAIALQVLGAIITAVTPLATTYFASLTTTALAAAYAGQTQAGNQAITYLIITLALGVVLSSWNSISSYYTALARFKIIASVSDKLTVHFLSLEYAKYDDRAIVDQFDRADRFARQSGWMLERLASLLSVTVGAIAGLVSLLLVSWWLGLILIIATVPGVAIQIKASREQMDHWNNTLGIRRKWNYLNNVLSDVELVAEVRVYNLVNYLMKLRTSFRNKAEREEIQQEKHFIKYRVAAYTIEAAAEAFALIYTTLQIIAHKLPVGQFLYVQQIISRTTSSVTSMTSIINSIDENVANLFDYTDFLELPTDKQRPQKLSAMPKEISLQHVAFSYPNRPEMEVLSDISFDIRKGQKVALVSENGAGKTTLVKLILGLYTPSRGTITLDNQDIDQIQPSSWHQFVSAMMQSNRPFTFANVHDNVMFGDISHEADEKAISNALRMAEAKEFVDKMPNGVNSYISAWVSDKKGINMNVGTGLSGGQKQRLMLARNFYRNSPFVILDEPTSAIDALAESRIFGRLFAEKSKTMLIISHRLTTVEKADVIYVLKDGKIVESGNHAELVTKHGEYYHIFESQLHS